MARARNHPTYFAWSNIRVPDPKSPGRFTEIKPGTEISAGALENEDEFNVLIEVGSVRTMTYPETRSDESPRAALLKDLRERQDALEIGYNALAFDMTDHTDETEEVDEVEEDDTATS